MEQALAQENTVYVVDDDESVRDSLCILLESKGYKVQAFPSALDYLNHASPAARGCMLVDVHMPGMDGIELITRLRKDRQPMPMIAMTGLRDSAMRERAKSAGAVALFDKPLAAPQLVEAVEAALRLPA